MEVSGARGEEITRNGRRSPIESPRERGTNRKLANVVMRGERLKKGRQGRLARGGGVRAATPAGWEDGSEGCRLRPPWLRLGSALAVTVGVGYRSGNPVYSSCTRELVRLHIVIYRLV